jgi:hypothetical protein
MRVIFILLFIVALIHPAATQPLPAPWTMYRGSTGLMVQYPTDTFATHIGSPSKGVGDRFSSTDGRYEFAAYTLENVGGDTPRAYLNRNLVVEPSSILYRRVTDHFFALSSVRNGRIYYSRCNFRRDIHCLYIEYPKTEKLAWDAIVTRMSLSLR